MGIIKKGKMEWVLMVLLCLISKESKELLVHVGEKKKLLHYMIYKNLDS
jgi:hypothetical protein